MTTNSALPLVWLVIATPIAQETAATTTTGQIERFMLLLVMSDKSEINVVLLIKMRMRTRRIHTKGGILLSSFNIELITHVGNTRIIAVMLPMKLLFVSLFAF